MKQELISISEAAKLLGISIDTLRRWDNLGRLPAVRSGPRGHRFYNLSAIEQFTQDQESLVRQWVEASLGVAPEARVYCQTRDVFQARLEKLHTELGRGLPLTITSLVTAVTGEIGNNSFDHNLGSWPDIPGIFFSYSLRNRTILLADRGQGILTTLRRVRPELADAQASLTVAFTETISGRFPEARGNGLKFVRRVIVDNPFTLFFQTGDAYLYLRQNDEAIVVKEAKTFVRGCFAKIGFGGSE